jgi:hypothetical protein
MQHSITIEVLSPTKLQWCFYEEYEDTLAGAKEHLFCVRKAFPDIAIRAIDKTTGIVLEVIKGKFSDE